MLKAKQVPDEVVEAALEAFTHASGLGLFPDEDEEWREDLVNGMRATIAAIINAWPGMLVEWHSRGPGIILPLPQEKTDDA